jgi:hypothetical protein
LNNTSETTVTLFDLDGVLIRPGGYRAAVKATINHFSRAMGLGEMAPQEAELAYFEANGVTSEWDMVPICLAFLIDRAGQRLPSPLPDLPLMKLFNFLADKGLSVEADYRADFSQLIPFLDSSIPAAECLLKTIQGGGLDSIGKSKLFVQELLGFSRQPSHSLTMRVFQNFILGDQGFSGAYGLVSDFETQSYLQTYDLPLLSSQNKAWLLSLIASSAILPAVITARPSLPPPGSADGLNVYSPEAEMALGLTGLGNIPLVGFGSMQYLGGQLGLLADSLVKPSPVQALAALASTLGLETRQSLFWAASVAFGNHQDHGDTPVPQTLDLHIFEDSTIGIVACQKAAELLQRAGHTVRLKKWGIGQNQDKIRALEQVGARVFPDVNQALGVAFEQFNYPPA